MADLTTAPCWIAASNPSLIDRPDEFVHLELETDWERIVTKPFDKFAT
jgi:hypothetical protein